MLKKDIEEAKEVETKKSRSPERKRSRSRSVDGSASGDSKRRKTAERQNKGEGKILYKSKWAVSSEKVPSADSRRVDVSFWRKNVHNTGTSCIRRALQSAF